MLPISQCREHRLGSITVRFDSHTESRGTVVEGFAPARA